MDRGVRVLAEALRGRVTVATLDGKAEPQTPKRDGIHTLPTVLVFQKGQVVEPLTGVVDRAAMAATLHALTGASQA